MFGATPEDILHVAQSLHHDIVPAARFGLPYTAWIDRRSGDAGYGATLPPAAEVNPTWRFTTLAELAQQHRQEGEIGQGGRSRRAALSSATRSPATALPAGSRMHDTERH